MRLRIVVVISAVVSLMLLAPVLREVYASLGTVTGVDGLWVVAAVGCVVAGFASTWALQRLALRVDRWSDVAGPQLAGNAASNLLSYASLFAVGLRPSPALVMVAFIAANTAGAVPLTPGGLGFVEAGLSGTLLLAGVREDPALGAVAIYRLVSNWLPITAGVFAYLWARRSATWPRVSRTSSVGAVENTCVGVPAAAHTVS